MEGRQCRALAAFFLCPYGNGKLLRYKEMVKDRFQFYVPVEIVKGRAKDGKDAMRISGVASTQDEDRDGEVMIPEGFDYTYLKDHGFINYHHRKEPQFLIGEPTVVENKANGLNIEGELYPDNEIAKETYKAIQRLGKYSKSRRFGWSIEGKVIERDPLNAKRVTKAKITGVALTPMPVNPATFVNIIKAMEADDRNEPWVDVDTTHDGNGGKAQLVLYEQKFENGGYLQILPDGIVRFKPQMGKALSTINARALILESVEGSVKDTQARKKYGGTVLLNKADVYERLFDKLPEIGIAAADRIVEKIYAKVEDMRGEQL